MKTNLMQELDPADVVISRISLGLQRRNILPVEIADLFHEALNALRTTSTKGRPPLNGTSFSYLASKLGISKGMISQYMSLREFSPKVKEEIIKNKFGLVKSYRLSRISGSNPEETESLQLQSIRMELEGIHSRPELLQFKTKTAEMVLRTISISKKIPLQEFTTPDTNNLLASAKVVQQNIRTCMEKIVPNSLELPVFMDELNFCEELLHGNHTHCKCGSYIDKSKISARIDTVKQEIRQIETALQKENKYVSSLKTVEKDLAIAIEQYS